MHIDCPLKMLKTQTKHANDFEILNQFRSVTTLNGEGRVKIEYTEEEVLQVFLSRPVKQMVMNWL